MTNKHLPIKIQTSVVIPCFNEAMGVKETLSEIFNVIGDKKDFEIIAVDDGSSDETLTTLQKIASKTPELRVLENKTNKGYGASLKKGILAAKGNFIVITDADGTYPATSIPQLLKRAKECHMAVGSRTGKNVNIPLLRRPAKWVLLKYARWMAKADIKDLNSGLRVFRKKDALPFFPLLPKGFSFTTTITLAMHANQMDVEYHEIDYRKRVGKSSIRPIHDTIAFFSLVLRTTMYFRPLQVFGSLSGFLITAAILVGIFGKIYFGKVPDVASISLFSTGLIFLGLGLIGDLVNVSRKSID
ncbi:MAG: glycosyltransferase family 2 protein [Opitutales bacterium]|nr:glycosyltransferase family 2 protein [Opitutales bacterium]